PARQGRTGHPAGPARLPTTDPLMAHPLSERIAAVLDLEPEARALEYDGRWFSWSEIAALARRIAALTAAGTRVGILLRNRPAQLAALLGVLLGEGCVVVLNPSRGDDRTRADIAALELPVIIGEPDDLATLATVTPRTTAVSLAGLTAEPQLHPAAEPRPDPGRPGVAVWMLTSGTTGPPKRID